MNTKVYSLLHVLVVNEERETEYEKWVNRFSLREVKRREERADTDQDIIFPIFCCSRWWLLAGSVFTASQRVWDPFAEIT